MRLPLAFAFVLLCGAAQAQTPAQTPPPTLSPESSASPASTASATPTPIQFEGVTLGEPMQGVRSRLGDPVQTLSGGGQQVWRYIERTGSVYVDVLAKENVAYSVTVVQLSPTSGYTDARGVSFGMSEADVRAKRGAAARRSINSDDGSVDLWYSDDASVWIYEFYGGKLGFIQVLPPHGIHEAYPAGPPVALPDGSSPAAAIRIRQPDASLTASWIDAYLATNRCGTGGHWNELTRSKRDTFTVVHARCSGGGAERDFFFDTSAP